MGSRFYRPKRDDRVSVGQDVLRDNARHVALEQLIPRIAVENQIAVETIVTPIHFYRKIRMAESRQCSCFDVEVSANSACHCCFGTGVVGGYDKFGTHTHIVDTTHPSIRAVNVYADYDRRTSPRQFILIPGARQGYIIARIRPKTNIGTVDHIFALFESKNGSRISAFLKATTDTEWVDFSKSAIEQRLYNPWIDIRFNLERPSINADSPRFAVLFLRYNRTTQNTIKANIPRKSESSMLQEFGVVDDWQEQKFWTDNTLRSVTSDDWVAHVNEGTRWKITHVSPFDPEGKLLSWEFDTRLVHTYEPMNVFPL